MTATMHHIRVAFANGRRRPKVCCGQDQKTKLWGVYRMVPTASGHTFDRELSNGWSSRKVAEAWAKLWRAENA